MSAGYTREDVMIGSVILFIITTICAGFFLDHHKFGAGIAFGVVALASTGVGMLAWLNPSQRKG